MNSKKLRDSTPLGEAGAALPFSGAGWKRMVFTYARMDDDSPTDLGGGYDPFGEEDAPTEIGAMGGNYRQPFSGGGDDDDTALGGSSFLREMDQTMLDIPELGTLGILWVLDGYRRGKIYKIADGDLVGKKEGKLILDDPKVSTPHCRFRIDKNKLVLWDCGSKNGTFVNGKRVTCATPLEENDQIKIGDLVFVYKVMN